MEGFTPLKQNDQIIIKPSDKGGNIVVMNLDQYKTMVMDLLLNRSWYKPIPLAQVNYAETKYRILVTRAFNKGMIDQKTLEFLTVNTPRLPALYALPKIQKNAKFPPGHPIVSGNGCLTEPASKLIDDYLRPDVKSLSSYIQDTADLLRSMDGICVPDCSWLVAIDVEALYNSIPHKLGVRVVEGFFI